MTIIFSYVTENKNQTDSAEDSECSTVTTTAPFTTTAAASIGNMLVLIINTWNRESQPAYAVHSNGQADIISSFQFRPVKVVTT